MTFFKDAKDSIWRHCIITILIILGTLPVPLVTRCLGFVLGLNVNNPLIIYTFPY